METVDLPEKFIERMRGELPENEREAFFAVYSRAGYEKGLLINSLKIDAGEFEKITPLTLDGAVPWNENARYVKNEKVGGDPYHCAGLYYMQEPSAACVAPKAERNAGNGCWIYAPLREEKPSRLPPPCRERGFLSATNPCGRGRRFCFRTSSGQA